MDAVRTEIERAGGTVTLSSELGEGTKISISLPTEPVNLRLAS
jgi:chemotaxis protein histidine kinase CheA